MRNVAMTVVLSFVSLVFGACADMASPTAPTVSAAPAPEPVDPPTPVAAAYAIEGDAPTNDVCLPPARGFRSWRLVVSDAGDAGMYIKATVNPSAQASCDGPFTTDHAVMRGWQTFAPHSSGVAAIELQHMTCGSARFTLWDGTEPIAHFRLNTGVRCYAPIQY